MKKEFTLMGEISNPIKKERDPEIAKIKYHQYDVIVERNEMRINIPVREAENFEKFMEGIGNVDISNLDLKRILRHYRGTRAEV